MELFSLPWPCLVTKFISKQRIRGNLWCRRAARRQFKTLQRFRSSPTLCNAEAATSLFVYYDTRHTYMTRVPRVPACPVHTTSPTGQGNNWRQYSLYWHASNFKPNPQISYQCIVYLCLSRAALQCSSLAWWNNNWYKSHRVTQWQY